MDVRQDPLDKFSDEELDDLIRAVQESQETFQPGRLMSAFGGKADMGWCTAHVRL
jgi:hypothetical protein